MLCWFRTKTKATRRRALLLFGIIAFTGFPAKAYSPCFDSLDLIYAIEEDVIDDSEVRTYILCPNVVYDIAKSFDTHGQAHEGMHPIIFGRSNMHVLCGHDGSSDNNCLLQGGMISVGFFDEYGASRPIQNALLQGVTMTGATSMNVWAQTVGDLTIRDCVFIGNRNISPIYAVDGYYSKGKQRSLGGEIDDAPEMQQQGATMRLVVSDCIFTENIVWHYSGNSVDGIVTIRGKTTVAEITNSVFSGTVLGSDNVKLPYLISNDGGQLTLRNNCFINNDERIAPVISANGKLRAKSSFLHRQKPAVPPTGCTFGALINSGNIHNSSLSSVSFSCVEPDASVCMSSCLPKVHIPCLQSLGDVYRNEKDLANDEITRTYILCHVTKYDVVEGQQDNEPILIARSNVRVLCGADGKSENECVVSGGRIQLSVNDEFQTNGAPLENVLIQGITFTNAEAMNVVVAVAGSIVIKDCIFKENSNSANIYIDPTASIDALSVANPRFHGVETRISKPVLSNDLLVSLYDSFFVSNIIGRGSGQASGLITSKNAMLRVRNSTFMFNQVQGGRHFAHYLIGNFAGSLDLVDNCFSSNDEIFAPVLSHLGTVDALQNYGTNARRPRIDQCEFIAILPTTSGGDGGTLMEVTPTCMAQFDGDTCLINDHASESEEDDDNDLHNEDMENIKTPPGRPSGGRKKVSWPNWQHFVISLYFIGHVL